jgi:pantothenate kinase type III
MPPPPRLLVELGNSTIKLAQQQPDGRYSVERFNDPVSFLALLPEVPSPIICAPVGQTATPELIDRLARTHHLRILTTDDFAELLGESYDTPSTIGLDRLLNLHGMGSDPFGMDITSSDGVVISCGTAITVDARCGKRVAFGAIMPGFRTAAEGLHHRLPQLPRVFPNSPTGLPARTSDQSVANGVLLGTALGAIGLAHELWRTLSDARLERIVLTGGDALLLQELWRGDVVPVVDMAVGFRGMMAATTEH